MSFKRSPSKVWWGSDSVEYREVSASPGSQDSGFSDTESSPQNGIKENNSNKNNKVISEEDNNNEATPTKALKPQLPKNIFKDSNAKQSLNLNSNYKEKSSPVKENIDQRLVKSDRKPSPQVLKKISTETVPFTEPVKRQRYLKHSPKVSRNLFTSKNTKECLEAAANQYSKLTPSTSPRSNEEPNEQENSWQSQGSDTSSEISGTKSLPLANTIPEGSSRLIRSAPTVLETSQQSSSSEDYEAVTSFNSASSDYDSELEHIFEDLKGAENTSTPKGSLGRSPDKMRTRRRRLQQRIMLKYQDQERVPPIHTDGITVDNQAVLRWLEEARLSIEQECTTTLQCKSIAAELTQKVNHLAACATTILRGLLSHSRCIEMDYKNLNSESRHIHPLVQSLAGNILDFLKTHTPQVSQKILRLHDQIKNLHSEQVLEPMAELFSEWECIQRQILVKEVRKLVDKLEDPTSDIDLRASLTGITSVALRNADLIEHFAKADIIPILLILCEKCDGSSIRTLILRALSTMCCNSSAIRHFEKFSGVQIIADTLEEESRPEPERSEAVALLAQVTAPWLEDNHSIKGLQEYSKKLVRCLTKFASTTRCCQNLLLCAAALANLSSMDSQCIQFLVHFETVQALLTAVKNRGPLASVYLLEQVATLLANMAAVEAARTQLTETEAIVALLHFLKPRTLQNEEVERRLQQKSMIALSRVCGDRNACRQVVDNGGLARLVELCREKGERFNSDAVLVAALATLRKIVEACGTGGLNVQDCQELVEPKLLDSFLAYSSQNESYV